MLHDAVLIMGPKHRERLSRSPRALRNFLKRIETYRIPLILLAQTGRLPGFFHSPSLSMLIPVACSSLDPFLLESRLVGLLREKLERRTARYGVLVERAGRGILITGESGIGKTTCALALAGFGYRFVADDRVVLEEDGEGRLYGCSHELIRRCIYLEERGVVDAAEVIGTAMTCEGAILYVNAELIREAADRHHEGCTHDDSITIMGVRLPHVHVPVHPDPRETARRVDRAAGTASAAELVP